MKLNALLPIILAVVITAVVVGGIAYLFMAPEKSIQSNEQIVQFNCEQSGGVYLAGSCDCSGVDGEFGAYEESTGYCITADGTPGGELGETARKLLEAKMLSNKEEAEAQIAKPEVTSINKTANGDYMIEGKTRANSMVWLYQVPEMDRDCLALGYDALNFGSLADAEGNFKMTYLPSKSILENLDSYEFAVISVDENNKYNYSWIETRFCAPDLAKSSYFKLTQ